MGGFGARQLTEFKNTVGKRAQRAVNSAIKVARKHGVKIDKDAMNKMTQNLNADLENKVNIYSESAAEDFKVGQNQADAIIKTPKFKNRKNMVKSATFDGTLKKLGREYSKRVRNIENPNIKKLLNNRDLKNIQNNLASAAKAQMKESGLKGNILGVAQHKYKENGVKKMASAQARNYLNPSKLNGALSKATGELKKVKV